MKPFFPLRMAYRETRGSRGRLSLYMVAITAGVASLVAIGSFRSNVTDSVRNQARTVLGADLELRARNEFPDTIATLVDSLATSGKAITRLVDFGSMVLAPSGNSRLLNVRAFEGGFPYYGTITSEPASAWSTFQESRSAVVDQAALVYLDATVGDTLAIGEARFEIAGFLVDFPGDLGIRTAVGPRVFFPLRFLEETRLLRFGSVATHRVYFEWDDAAAVQSFLDAHDSLFTDQRIGSTTVEEVEEDLGSALEGFSRFLGLIGLIALILGGLGVASGIHVFVRERLDTVAVLRCLGARQPLVFQIYLLQAVMVGLGGAAIGALLGLGVQALLPLLLADFLPLDIAVTPAWTMVVAGLTTGVWTAFVFALFPLLTVREVSPLRALSRNFGVIRRKRDPARFLAAAALVVSLVLVSVWQAPTPLAGLAFAAAIGVTTGILALTAWVITRSARRYFPRKARYELRQGLANLFRPQNQTVSVVLTLGFGIFMLTTLSVVQRSLLDQLSVDTDQTKPNLVFFDVQSDQRAGLTALFAEEGLPDLGAVPIVPARMAAVNGRPVAEILADSSTDSDRWMYRREYRHTYRDSLSRSERIVAGEWFDAAPKSELTRISLDADIAEGLGIGIGDRITWDFQGVELETVVTSLRAIDWARFEPNFFVVFEPGALEQAPQTFLYLTRAEDPVVRARTQRSAVERFSNISVVDLGMVLNTIDRVVGKIALAIRFMALFSIASGLVVLAGAIATTKYQRVQEAALLRTLGASSQQVRRIIATEYAMLGAAAGLTGILLAVLAGWALTEFLFEISLSVSLPTVLGFWSGLAVVTVGIGAWNSRGVTTKPPLATLRELSE
jgi:putative ABC transport system permease protein